MKRADNGGDWPVIGIMNQVMICKYMGKQHKGEPIEKFRIQLMGRPGRPFLFVDAMEWEGLVEICRQADPMAGYDTGRA